MSRIVIWITLLFFACQAAYGAVEVNMQVDQNVAVEGDDVTFLCRVKGAGSGIIVYLHKEVYNRNGTKQYELIATNDLLTPLYENLGRFHADNTVVADAMHFTLDIYGVTKEDTGFYGCYLPKQEINHSARFEVYKGADSVRFEGKSSMDPYVFTEGQSIPVTCIVDNVVPDPRVSVTIDGVHYEHLFNKTLVQDTQCAESPGSKKCPLHFNYDVRVTNPKMEVNHTAHGKFLVCESHMNVPFSGLPFPVVEARVPVVVNYSPKFSCGTELKASLNEPYNISCVVDAHPVPSNASWRFRVSENDVILYPGTSWGIFRAIKEHGNGSSLIYTLVNSRVFPAHLVSYTLQMQQLVANNSLEITLTEKPVTTTPVDSASITSFTFVTLLISIMTADIL